MLKININAKNKQINNFKKQILMLRIIINEQPMLWPKIAHIHQYLDHFLTDWI